jgi:DNA repair protein RadC
LSINSGYRWSRASVFPASEADIRITKTVKEALKLMDIELLDHLILTYEEKYSTIETDGLESG